MRAWGTVLAVTLAGWAAPAGAQSEAPRTAEQFIETAREAYSVDETRPEACPAPVGNEIVVCRRLDDPDQFRVASPTERAYAAGTMPPDPVPSAPDLWGGMQGGVIVAKGCFIPPCPRPMPPIIDFSKIPKGLTPEEAALVFRAEDRPQAAASPEAASPAAAP